MIFLLLPLFKRLQPFAAVQMLAASVDRLEEKSDQIHTANCWLADWSRWPLSVRVSKFGVKCLCLCVSVRQHLSIISIIVALYQIVVAGAGRQELSGGESKDG